MPAWSGRSSRCRLRGPLETLIASAVGPGIEPLGPDRVSIVSGIAEVCEWYEEASEEYRIEVVVTNRRWGRLFGYHGRFDVEWKPVTPEAIPPHMKPVREEKRE